MQIPSVRLVITTAVAVLGGVGCAGSQRRPPQNNGESEEIPSCLSFREIEGAAVTDGMVRAYRAVRQQITTKQLSEEEIAALSSPAVSTFGGVVNQSDEAAVFLSDGRKVKQYLLRVDSSKLFMHDCFGSSSMWMISTRIGYSRSKSDPVCKIGEGSSSADFYTGHVHPVGLVRGLKVGNFDKDPNNKTDIAIELLDGTLVFYLQK